MKRRHFLQGSLTAAAIMVLGSRSKVHAMPDGFKGIIYTKDNPGQWLKKIDSHAPTMEREGNTVNIETKHPMTESHFIVRHSLVLEDGSVVGAVTFTPKDSAAKSSFTLPKGYTGKIYATSFCNMHDFWVSEG